MRLTATQNQKESTKAQNGQANFHADILTSRERVEGVKDPEHLCVLDFYHGRNFGKILCLQRRHRKSGFYLIRQSLCSISCCERVSCETNL
jgi:hypothetical protein